MIIEATIDAEGRVSNAKILQIDPHAGRRRIGGGASVGVHANVSERRTSAGDHDRHGEFHIARLNQIAIRDPRSAMRLSEPATRA